MHGCKTCAVVFSISLAAASASALAQPAATRDRIESLIAKAGRNTEVAVVAQNLADGSTWIAHNVTAQLKPASVMKLFTTSAALLRFGPGFQFQTPVYVKGDELWIIGSGDPAIGDERLAEENKRPRSWFLDQIVQALQAAPGGLPRIARIVVDDSIFDQQLTHPTWPAEQYQAWYQAPVAGLNYNDNCLDSQIRVNGGVQLVLIPPLPAEFIHNTLSLSKKHAPIVRRGADSDVFEFSGPVSKSDGVGPVTFHRPAVIFGHAVRARLEAARLGDQIEVVRRTIRPEDARSATLLFTNVTPLRDVIWRANTFSQNLFAECLVKSLPAYEPDGRRSGRPGNWPDGTALVQQTLSRLGVDLRDAQLLDGSGLSHENHVSAQQIVQLLSAMHHRAHRDVFMESLADPGEEGTMRRKRDPALIGHLRGKTGTLANVHALAGYLTRDDGATLAFAVLINGPGGADLPVQIAKALVQ